MKLFIALYIIKPFKHKSPLSYLIFIFGLFLLIKKLFIPIVNSLLYSGTKSFSRGATLVGSNNFRLLYSIWSHSVEYGYIKYICIKTKNLSSFRDERRFRVATLIRTSLFHLVKYRQYIYIPILFPLSRRKPVSTYLIISFRLKVLGPFGGMDIRQFSTIMALCR